MEIKEFERDMTYRESLLNTACTLIDFAEELYDRIFEITMTGEMKEWSDTVPTGETIEISYDLFKACDDLNVVSMLELRKSINDAIDTFTNINAITTNEIDTYRHQRWLDIFGDNDSDSTNLPF